MPRINGARVFGVRPGRPFLFSIPATGDRPMEFSIGDLPEGLTVDPKTGQITGSLRQPGQYIVMFRAKNALGQAERTFKIVCGDTLALTPPMGWNPWYVWEVAVTDKIVRTAADAMVSTGMINHGWTYINIDDGWAVQPGSSDPMLTGQPRDAQGNINLCKHFPDMKALADYIHSKGLKAGIYSSPGPLTCGGGDRVGSYGHEEQDARRFAEWGYDFLKYDWCTYRNIATNADLAAYQKPYRQMGDILKKLDRDIVFNLCQYGMGNVWEWGREVGGHSWRSAIDLGPYDRLRTALLSDGFDMYGRNELQKFNGPGGWNDLDYLLLGYIGDWKGEHHQAPTPLSPNEQYSYMSLWCLLATPLFFSGDLTRLDEFTLSLLTNDEVLEVDQDPLGKSALRVAKSGNIEVWAKDMEDGSKAVGLFNRGDVDATVTAKWSDLGLKAKQMARDLWRQETVGTFEDEFSAPVPPHGVMLLRFWPTTDSRKNR
jgi:alpha-galactosidase